MNPDNYTYLIKIPSKEERKNWFDKMNELISNFTIKSESIIENKK